MLNPVASGEADDGALSVRPVDRVHASDLDVEGGLHRLTDLSLVRAGPDDEGVLAVVGQPQALLRDDRPQQDVPRVDNLVHCCSSSCSALAPAVGFAAEVARATKLSSASWVNTTWSLTSTSLVFNWPSSSTCTSGTLRRLSLV